MYIQAIQVLPLNPPKLWAGNIDYHKPDRIELAKKIINIGGWILGKTTPIVNVNLKIQLFDQEQTIASVIRNYPRSDIGVAFSNVRGAENSGFDFKISGIGRLGRTK